MCKTCTEELKMKNKMMWSFLALFVLGAIALGGLSYAYRGDATAQGPNYNADVHEQLEAALKAGDYETWLIIREENNLPTRGRIFSSMSEENFNKYAQMHEANLAGDYETADSIRAEMGLGQGSMKRTGEQGQMKNKGSRGSGSQQRMNSFVDVNGDGVCDNYN